MIRRKVSGQIDFRKLERESYRWLFAGFAFAVSIHALLAFLTVSARIREADEARQAELLEKKPLPISLLIKKRAFGQGSFHISKPRQTERTLRPDFQQTAPDLPQPENRGAIKPQDELHAGTIKGHETAVSPPEDFDRRHIMPEGLGLANDGIERFGKNHLSMTDEMISIEHLDTGEHKALVVVDPNDRHSIKGFFHYPCSIFGANFHSSPPFYPYEKFVISQYTGIKFKFDKKPVALSDPTILKYPFLIFTIGGPFDLTDTEAKMLFEYCEKGGLIFFEPVGPDFPRGIPYSAPYVKNMIFQIFGQKARLRQIPDNHQLYHCFFDYDVASGYNHYPIDDYDAYQKQPLFCLEGIFYKGRLAVIYSEKGYSCGWGSEQYMTSSHFGVNLMVYALTRNANYSPVLVDVSTQTEQVSRRGWDYMTREKFRHTEKSAFNPNYSPAGDINE